MDASSGSAKPVPVSDLRHACASCVAMDRKLLATAPALVSFGNLNATCRLSVISQQGYAAAHARTQS